MEDCIILKAQRFEMASDLQCFVDFWKGLLSGSGGPEGRYTSITHTSERNVARSDP